MNLIRKLLEILRDHSRDELCARLRALGVEARLASRGRPEEKFTAFWNRSLGVIDVSSSPIQSINLVKWGNGEDWGIWVEYIIPNAQIPPGNRNVSVTLRRSKSLNPFRRNRALRWVGADSARELINALKSDSDLNNSLLHDVVIRAYPRHGCWIFSTSTLDLTRELWSFYERIARHLRAVVIHLEPVKTPEHAQVER